MVKRWVRHVRSLLEKTKLKVIKENLPNEANIASAALEHPDAKAMTFSSDPADDANKAGLEVAAEMTKFLIIEKPSIFAPLSIQWQERSLTGNREDDALVKSKLGQAPNYELTWSMHQADRRIAMSGPRFTGIDLSKQVKPSCINF
jgi:hypothetical protein